MSTFIFVDRRSTGRGKSINNRQKLLRRIKDSIKNTKAIDVDSKGVAGAGASAPGLNNPVKVARSALHEPTFHYAPNSGDREIVLIGNDQWLKGDEFPVSGGSGQGKGKGEGNGPGEDGEDDFIVNISRSEFFEVFFEDCELPDLQDTHEKELPQANWKPAGFRTSGNPSQLSVIRSFKQSLSRRMALTSSSRSELEKLEAEYEELAVRLAAEESEEIHARMEELELLISELRKKISSTTLFEDVDLRYRKKVKEQIKSADAVFVMIMDVSGSMDEDKKRMARKMFSLQYAFIKRKYPQTDLVFIAHTDSPVEMTEEEFFTTRLSGGTIVSSAWKMAHDIIKERYDPALTNIYLSSASDGDNYDSDNAEVLNQIEGSGLLAKVRHVVYVQVGQSYSASYYSSSLWNTMKSIASTAGRKFTVAKIETEHEVFAVFKSIYGKVSTK